MKYQLIISLLALLFSVEVFAQSAMISADSLPSEEIFVFTDREVYCVEETVHAKIFYQLQTYGEESLSKVAYCEIITPEGRSIVKSKSLISDNFADVEFSIPRNTLSGNYYLRAYTKWMRNQSTSSFFYKRIKIINPFTSEVLKNVLAKGDSVISVDQMVSKTNAVSIVKSDSVFPVNTDVEFLVNANCDNCFKDNLAIAVVKKGTLLSDFIKIEGPKVNIKDTGYIPETRGVSLSGKIINKTDSLPVSFANVWITLLTPEPVTREALSDQEGNFYFDLGTETGHFDLFISATTTKENIEPIVCVDNDFSFAALNLPFVPFEITESDRGLYEKLIIDGQLENIFTKVNPSSDSITFSFDKLFYGKPDFSLKFGDFIELPTIEDYISELLPNISLRKVGAKRFFKMYSDIPDMAFNDPLVMVNLIKVNDAEPILKLSPKQIDRVEIIKFPYLRGEMIYGGIIHIITKSANFSDINFPDGSVFVEYSLLSEKNIDKPVKTEKHAPIVGNCLYWQPNFSFGIERKGKVHFNSGSEKGLFEIVIKGFDKEGNPFQVNDSFSVE